MQGGVGITCVAGVVQARRHGTILLRNLRIGHILQEFCLLFRGLHNHLVRRLAQHGDDLVGLELDGRELGIRFNHLTSHDLLVIGLYIGEGVELELKILAGRGRVDLDVVDCALVLYFHRDGRHLCGVLSSYVGVCL